MDPTEAHEMNKHGHHFGMSSNDFYSFLTDDLEEAETYRLAKEEEHEKALFSGRKSRRERRAHREKRLANRIISPPSYAAQASPTNPLLNVSRSPSRSPSPENAGKITYITSFGDDEDPPSTSKPTYADKVKYGKPKTERIVYRRRSREGAKRRRSPSRSRSRTRRSSRRRSNSRSVSQEKCCHQIKINLLLKFGCTVPGTGGRVREAETGRLEGDRRPRHLHHRRVKVNRRVVRRHRVRRLRKTAGSVR